MIRRVAGGVGANVLGKLVIAATQLAMVPVLVTRWGVPTYGLWVLFSTIPAFLAISDFGFATAAGTKMTMAVALGRRDEAVHVFHSGWVAVLATSAAMIVLTVAAAWLLPARLLGEAPRLNGTAVRATLTLLFVYGIAALQGSIFFAGFQCAGLFARGSTCNAFIILGESVAAITVVLLGGQPIAAAGALLAGRLVGLAGQNLLLRRSVPWLRIGVGGATLAEIRALLPPAIAVMVLPLAQACVLQGNALALGVAAGQAAVPSFVAVRTLSRVGLQMCWLLNAALMPEFSAASARGDRRGLGLMLLATLGVSVMLVLPYAAVFAVLGRSIVRLWTGGVLHPSPALILVMSGTILFGGFWYPVSNLILALNRHAAYTYAFVALAVTSVVVSYVLSLHVGAVGAGIAMLLLDAAMACVIARQATRMIASGSELRALAGQVPGLSRAVWDRLRSLRRRA